MQVEGVVSDSRVDFRPRRQLVVRLHDASDELVLRFLNFYGSQVKQMAIGYGIGLVRDVLKDALPTLGEKVEQVMDSATHKMGGEPVHGRVMGEEHHDQTQADNQAAAGLHRDSGRGLRRDRTGVD